MGGNELSAASGHPGDDSTEQLSVSVIVPVFNNAVPLRECLRALEAQTLPRDRYEIVVVDNGSTDGTAADLEDRPGRRVVLERTPGSYAARNRGVVAARGRVFAFTDSDCLAAKNWLERGLAALGDDLSPVIVAGRVDLFYQDPRHPTAVEVYERLTALDQHRFVEQGGFGATANLFVPRQVFERAGPFDGRLKSSGDVEWCQRAVSRGGVLRYVPDVRVSHPARRTLSELHRKVARTIGGAHDARGKARLLGIDRPAIADWIPPIRYAWTALWNPVLPRRRDRVRAAGVMFFVRYAEAFERLRLRLGGTSQR